MFILGIGTTAGFAVTGNTWTNVMTASSTTLTSNDSSLLGTMWTVTASTLVWSGQRQTFMVGYDVTSQSNTTTDTMQLAIGVNSTTTPVVGSRAGLDFVGAFTSTAVSKSFAITLNQNDAITVLINVSNSRSAAQFFIAAAAITLIGSIPE
jgi:hypothetical protein